MVLRIVALILFPWALSVVMDRMALLALAATTSVALACVALAFHRWVAHKRNGIRSLELSVRFGEPRPAASSSMSTKAFLGLASRVESGRYLALVGASTFLVLSQVAILRAGGRSAVFFDAAPLDLAAASLVGAVAARAAARHVDHWGSRDWWLRNWESGEPDAGRRACRDHVRFFIALALAHTLSMETGPAARMAWDGAVSGPIRALLTLTLALASAAVVTVATVSFPRQARELMVRRDLRVFVAPASLIVLLELVRVSLTGAPALGRAFATSGIGAVVAIGIAAAMPIASRSRDAGKWFGAENLMAIVVIAAGLCLAYGLAIVAAGWTIEALGVVPAGGAWNLVGHAVAVLVAFGTSKLVGRAANALDETRYGSLSPGNEWGGNRNYYNNLYKAKLGRRE